MIKGIAKHVVVVKTPDPEMFEEAIFVVKDSYLAKCKGSRHEVMKMAERTAEKYLQESLSGTSKRGKKSALPWKCTARITGRGQDE